MSGKVKSLSKCVPPKLTNCMGIFPTPPSVRPQRRARDAKGNEHEGGDVVDGTQPGRKPNDGAQDVRDSAQEWERGEVGFWAVGGVVDTRVECGVVGVEEGGKVEEKVVEDEFVEGRPEEIST